MRRTLLLVAFLLAAGLLLSDRLGSGPSYNDGR